MLEATAHEKIDVAVVEIEPVDGGEVAGAAQGIVFRDPCWADETWTYLRVPLARDPAPLVVHKGEVVSPRVSDLFGHGLSLFSATARPGNSGGPIVAQDGRVLGIVTRSLEVDNGAPGMPAANAPFYAGVPTSEILTALTDMGFATVLNVERWELPSRDRPSAANEPPA
ncbi:trypsin-like peptidase domain-containing protein [Nocardia xishanensis]